ncbi:MAG: nicotinate-nucleotide adenylyltransferase, partial [Gammaproteobacteria bacterium]|nr:nicotinate-nucleotide adenylyltransferase [Gammaproteobacteria bacterium]
HLRLALELYDALELAEVRFIPLRTAPHRDIPLADSALRRAMLETAIRGEPRFKIDDRELHREGPSYTVDTMISLREEVGDTPLCLIMGMDAFRGLIGWHRWTMLSELVHIVVVERPGADRPEDAQLKMLLTERSVEDPTALHHQSAGHVLLASVPMLDIAGSRIRSMIAGGRNPRYLLPSSVLALIRQHRLYTHH